MEKQVLFTVTDIKGTSVPIYGPTNQKLESSKPVASTHKYSSDVIRERISLLKAHEKYQNKNKYFQQGKMDIWEQEKKDIMTLSNWKLRVLEEQKKKEEDEIKTISNFLPSQLSKKQIDEIINNTIKSNHLNSMKDMGIAIKIIKEQYDGMMDFGYVSKVIKEKLSNL